MQANDREIGDLQWIRPRTGNSGRIQEESGTDNVQHSDIIQREEDDEECNTSYSSSNMKVLLLHVQFITIDI